MGLGWSRGSFSGNLVSRFSDVNNAESADTFYSSVDIDFAWRTPWQGSLSVGAKNLLGARPEGQTSDVDFDRILGRVPYIRYHQDF